jgi:hypothetical protein
MTSATRTARQPMPTFMFLPPRRVIAAGSSPLVAPGISGAGFGLWAERLVPIPYVAWSAWLVTLGIALLLGLD